MSFYIPDGVLWFSGGMIFGWILLFVIAFLMGKR